MTAFESLEAWLGSSKPGLARVVGSRSCFFCRPAMSHVLVHGGPPRAEGPAAKARP